MAKENERCYIDQRLIDASKNGKIKLVEKTFGKPLNVTGPIKYIKIPENIKPIKIPENIKPIKIPENIKPIKIPENIKPIKIPENIKPISDNNKIIEEKPRQVR